MIVGPLPFDQVAEKAVGMPPDPGSTVKPSAFSLLTYHSAERYSRQAVSASDHMWKFHPDQSPWRSATKAKAVSLARSGKVVTGFPSDRAPNSSFRSRL